MDELKTLCAEYLAWLKSDDYNEDEQEKWEDAIFEKAMEVSLGENIWDEINALGH
jgi:hypothetical protein